MDVSILLIGKGSCQKQIDYIRTRPTNYEYEIVVCSDEEHEDVVYIQDQGTSVSSLNEAYRNSNGQYIITCTNVVLPPSNMFDMVDKLSVLPTPICSPTGRNGRSPLIPEWAVERSCLHFRPQILRWPCFSRHAIDRLLSGVIFPRRFNHHYVDNWLGTYLALIGLDIKEDPHFRIQDIPHTAVSEYDEADKLTYEYMCDNFHRDRKYDF